MYEELYEGRELSGVINDRHENVKYLPGISLPENLLAVASLQVCDEEQCCLQGNRRGL